MQLIKTLLVQLRKYIALLILKIFGWRKGAFHVPNDLKKGVLIGAPHTSYWDTFWGVLASYAYLSEKSMFGLFKMEANKSFWGRFYVAIGGIPVDRQRETLKGKRTSMVTLAAEKIKSMDEIILCLSPEGTRKLNPKWKTGFYYIALEANVPILISTMDFKKKEIAILQIIYPSGDFQKDIKKINSYYKDVSAKFPEKFQVYTD